jgi:DNA polymerase III epsilon subunit-like protein
LIKNRKNEIGDIHVYMMNISEETYEKYADEEAKKYEEEQ